MKWKYEMSKDSFLHKYILSQGQIITRTRLEVQKPSTVQENEPNTFRELFMKRL